MEDYFGEYSRAYSGGYGVYAIAHTGVYGGCPACALHSRLSTGQLTTWCWPGQTNRNMHKD